MTAWLTDALIASTLLMLIVLAIRRPAAHLFGPRITYVLWLLPALRMALPRMPEATPLPTLAALPFSSLPQAAHYAYALGRGPHVAAVSAPADWTIPLVWIWSAGALLTLGLALVAHERFQNAIKAGGKRVGDVDGVPLWTSTAVGGPLAFGLVAPGVAIPQDYMDRYAPDELEFVLRHEAMHHRRRDLAVNLAALVVRSLHWFNPIAYWAHRAFRDDQELACDAAVLADENAAGRQAYGWALVKSACGAFPAAACAMDSKGQLKRRLAMMNRAKNSRARAFAGGALIAAAIGAGLGVTASNSIAAPAPKAMQRFVSAAVPMVHAIPVPTHTDLHVAAPPAAIVSLALAVPPATVPLIGSISNIPPVPRIQSTPRLAALPRAPSAPALPRAPDAPTHPETPPVGAIPDIDATVRAAMAQARAAIARAHAQAARAHVDIAQIHRDVASSLRESLVEIRAERDMPGDLRARIVATIEREIERFERD